MEKPSDRWKPFEERVKSASGRIEKAQERASDETVAALRETIRERIEQGSKSIAQAGEEAVAEAARWPLEARSARTWAVTPRLGLVDRVRRHASQTGESYLRAEDFGG